MHYDSFFVDVAADVDLWCYGDCGLTLQILSSLSSLEDVAALQAQLS